MKRQAFIAILAVASMMAADSLAADQKRAHLKFGVGKKSMFVMPNGDRAIIVGIAGLKFSDFSVRESDKMLTFEDPRIIDAEKSSKTHADDFWCEQMTDCNLLVWTGWAKWAMGITNEDDFAEMLLKDPSVCRYEIIDWTMSHRGYSIDDSTAKVIAWGHAKPENCRLAELSGIGYEPLT